MPVNLSPVSASQPPKRERDTLSRCYSRVRASTLVLAAPLSAEDQCVQSMPDASPTKWHLAHTSWFFEALVLLPHLTGYQPFNSRFAHLFNSYYESLGARLPRPQRGLLTRPNLAVVHAYREHVDAAMQVFMAGASESIWKTAAPLIEIGLNHEQQHQELLLTDILHVLSRNPLLPAYQSGQAPASQLSDVQTPLNWVHMPGGTVEIGNQAQGFAFDNELPRHLVLTAPYRIAERLVTCGEYAQFITDGGYERPLLWLSDGWSAVQSGGWTAPLYWIKPGDPRAPATYWQEFGLNGVQPLSPGAPVRQISFYEAAAYAQWAGARLPTEFEWEAAYEATGITQMTGHAWQWTRSSYDPYPGFRPLHSAVGEYNGKFMVGQLVLRGGSAATPHGHTRPTYRNFFPPGARWQFSGLRLAMDAS